MSTKLEKTSLSGQVYILTRLVEYLVKCSYYTMSTKLEKTSLSGQVYILTRLVEYLVKCSYYTMSIGHDTLWGRCAVRPVFCPALRDTEPARYNLCRDYTILFQNGNIIVKKITMFLG